MSQNDKPDKPKRFTYKGRGLVVKGVWYPLNEVETPDLIKYLRTTPAYTLGERKKQKFLSWVIEWRNKNDAVLPKNVRYNPIKWKLSDVTPYNYPQTLYELSLLYRLALLREDIGRLNVLHDALLHMGYIYVPAKYIQAEEKWESDKIIPVDVYEMERAKTQALHRRSNRTSKK